MQAIMQVMQLQSGNYGVKSIGGTMLNRIVAEFQTEIEAEEWMMRHTQFARAGSGIMRPGDGENVA